MEHIGFIGIGGGDILTKPTSQSLFNFTRACYLLKNARRDLGLQFVGTRSSSSRLMLRKLVKL